MKNKPLVLFSVLVLIVIGVVLGINRSRGPSESTTSPSSSAVTASQGSHSGLGDPIAAGQGRGAQVVSGLKPHETQSGPLPSSRYDYDEPVAHAGQMVVARVTLGEQVHDLRPNQVGGFPRVNVSAKQVIPVVVSYPEAKPGQAVVIQSMDGGKCVEPGRSEGIDHDLVRMVTLDEKRVARFAVQVSEYAGTHRYVLMRGADQKVLDFWVEGQEMAAKE
jgi:hypothetical protein